MWRLGDFEVDPSAFELRRRANPSETGAFVAHEETTEMRRIPIQRRPLDLLIHLIEHAGEVVSRPALVEAVWKGVAVSEGAIDTAVYELRTALGDLDRPAARRIVETVRGRGLRINPSTPVERHPTKAAPPSDFVGRRATLDARLSGLARALEGQGGLLVVDGVAGIGKTRLVKELVTRLRERHARDFSVHYVWAEEGAPEHWLTRQLESEFPDPPADSPDEPPAGPADAFQRRQAVRSRLFRAAASRPRILVIEDIHWADGGSLELIEDIAPRLGGHALAVVATERTEGPFPSGRLRAMPSIDRQTLHPLSVPDVYRMIELELGVLPSPDVVGWVFDRSDGIPLFVREIAAGLESADAVPSDDVAVGVSLLTRQIARLEDSTRKILSIAALCGEHFDVDLVERALRRTSDPDRSWLAEATRAGIIRRRSRNQPLHFLFSHALFREAALADLDPIDRARGHQAIVGELERQRADATPSGLTALAHHAAGALLVERSPERAFRYSMAAAQDATARHSWSTAADLAERMLSWIDALPPGNERDEQELCAQLLRCAAIFPRESSVEECGTRLERIDALFRSGAGQAKDRAMATGIRYGLARSRGDARFLETELTGLEADASLAFAGRRWRRALAGLAGNHAEALAGTADPKAYDAFQEHVATGAAWDPTLEALAYGALSAWAVGRDGEAVRRARRAIRWSEERDDPRSIIWARFLAMMLHELRRDWKTLRDVAAPMDPLGHKHGITPWLGAGTGISAWATHQEEGTGREAAVPMAQILEHRGSAPSTSFRSGTLLLASQAYRYGGAHDEAIAVLDRVIAFVREGDERLLLPEMFRQAARLACDVEDLSAASRHWSRGIEEAERQDATTLLVRLLADRFARKHSTSDRARLASLAARTELDLGPHERELIERATDRSA